MLVGFLTSFVSLFTTQLYQVLGAILSPLHSCLTFVQSVFATITGLEAFGVAIGWIKYFFPSDVMTIFAVIVALEFVFVQACIAISIIKGLRYWVLMRG